MKNIKKTRNLNIKKKKNLNLFFENFLFLNKILFKNIKLNQLIKFSLYFFEKQKLKNKIFIGLILKKKYIYSKQKFKIILNLSNINSNLILSYFHSPNIIYYNCRKSELN